MRRAAIGVAVLAVGLAGAGMAVAQEAPGAAERPRPALIDRLINELALTQDQVAKVKDLEAQRRERLQAAGRDAAKRREVTTWFQTEVRKLLTDEQAKKYDSLTIFRPEGQRGEFVSQWRERLGLTADQVEKISALGPVFRQKLQEAGEDREKRREVWQWYQNEIRSLLTEEQRKKYDAAVTALRERVALQGLAQTDWALRGLELNEEQRKKVGDLQKARDEKVKAAYDAYKQGLKGVLTPEQMKKFEENLRRLARPVRQPAAGRRGRTAPGGATP